MRLQYAGSDDTLTLPCHQEGCLFVRGRDVIQVRVEAGVEGASILLEPGEDQGLDGALVVGTEGAEGKTLRVADCRLHVCLP